MQSDEETLFGADSAANPAFAKMMQILNRTSCSEHTLRLKMRRYEFEAEQVERALEQVKEFGFVDDYKYAAEFAEREVCGKARSKRIARMKLLQKGIPEDIVDQALESIDPADEQARAREFLAQKLEHLMRNASENDFANGPDMLKIKQRLYGVASRRGIAYEVVKQVLSEHSA